MISTNEPWRSIAHAAYGDDIVAAWEACARADYMVWIAAACGVDLTTIAQTTCACVRASCGRDVSDFGRWALEIAEMWADGRATLDGVRAVASGMQVYGGSTYANFAAECAIRIAAAYNEDDAVSAAGSALRCAADAYATAAGANMRNPFDRAAAAARAEAQRRMAAIVRQHIPFAALTADKIETARQEYRDWQGEQAYAEGVLLRVCQDAGQSLEALLDGAVTASDPAVIAALERYIAISAKTAAAQRAYVDAVAALREEGT